MIAAEVFVERARARGFDWYAGVPCSFLTPFINYTISDDSLRYIACANEGDAVATAAGAVIAGRRAVAMMQNSGLGNAVNPLTSLTHTFRIPVLLIVTLRGEPGLSDEPQHELMGRITGRMLEEMEIPWDWFPAEADGIDAVLDRIDDHHREHARPFALVMRKGSVAPFPLPPERTRFTPERTAPGTCESIPVEAGRAPSRREVLERIVARTPEDRTVVIGTTGYTGRELSAIADRANHFYMVGSMGCATSIGLGLSLARPDLRVVVIDGDGAALMRMGSFATVGAYGQSNLLHLLLDNACHESTGAQATVSAGVSFARIAQACGYGMALEGGDIGIVDRLLEEPTTTPGPRFGRIHLERGVMENLPRPELKPEAVHRRLAQHLAETA